MKLNHISTHREALNNLRESLYPFAASDKLKELLDTVQFAIAKCDFGASLNPSNNTITLDPSLFQGPLPSSSAIESALFELINLSQKNNFRELVNKIETLVPDEFVKDYETIEYRTAAICKKILQKKIPSEQWDDYPLVYTTNSFPLHYLLQQLSGHSQKIYEKYKDRFNTTQPYQGSWPTPNEEEDRQILLQLLYLKIGSEAPETDFGKTAEAAYKRLRNGVLNNPYYTHLGAYIRRIESAANP